MVADGSSRVMTSDTHHASDGKVLNHSEATKRQLEREAAKHFMRLYERSHKTPMRHIWHNEPAKPDISCYLDGQPLDMEIAHLYANSSEAKTITHQLNDSAHSTGNGNGQRETKWNGNQELFNYLADLSEMDKAKRLKTALVRILNSKSHKTYDSKRVWLIIRNASPIWQFDDFLDVIPHIHLLKHPFEKIWLLPDFDGQDDPILISR